MRTGRRDRSGSGSRSVQFRVEIGPAGPLPGGRNHEAGISARVRRRRRPARAGMPASR